MGILDRFTDIIKANINDLLDRAEDPAKMIDQYMRELTDNLAEVKEETAAVMAEESRTKRLVDQNAAEVAKYQGLARRALEAGNEGDARVFLAKKQELESKGQALSTTYEAAKANAQKMRDLHDKLVTDIETLNGRREAIKAKVSVAKTQSMVNEFSSGADKAEGAWPPSPAWRPRRTRCSTRPTPRRSSRRARATAPPSSRRSTPPPATPRPSTTSLPASRRRWVCRQGTGPGLGPKENRRMRRSGPSACSAGGPVAFGSTPAGAVARFSKGG